MVTPQYENLARPKLREEIILGPAIQSGNQVFYHLKDKTTDRFFRVGEKEQFIISRLDGENTFENIVNAYANSFNCSLDKQAQRKILSVLANRHLLEGVTTQTELKHIKDQVQTMKKEGKKGFFPIWDPNRFLDKLFPSLQIFFRPAFVIPVLFAVLITDAFIIFNFRQIWRDAFAVQNNMIMNGAVISFFIIAILHEIAHSAACKYFGGSPGKIGLMWHFVFLASYAKVDDVLLFHKRRHRVYTAFAGVFSTLLFIPPLTLLWLLSPESSINLKQFTALLLLALNFFSLFNLLPFFGMDGYQMLNHSLGIIELRQSSYKFWKEKIGGLFHIKNRTNSTDYSGIDKIIYSVYGFLSFWFTIVFYAAILAFNIRIFQHWLN